MGDEGGNLTIRFYLNQIVPDKGDLPTYDALNLAKKYVGTVMPDNEGEENDEEIETNGVGGELVIGSEVEAKGVISELSTATQKRLFTLLAEHDVEVEYRKKQPLKMPLVGCSNQIPFGIIGSTKLQG